MPFTAYPEHLDMLSKALRDHCSAAGIKADTPEHDQAALRVLVLFENGAETIDELMAGLTRDHP